MECLQSVKNRANVKNGAHAENGVLAVLADFTAKQKFMQNLVVIYVRLIAPWSRRQ